MPSIIKRAYGKLKTRYNEAQEEKHRYQEVDKEAAKIHKEQRYQAYKANKLTNAKKEAAVEGKRMAGSRRSRAGTVRGTVGNALGVLSQGSANALKSGAFDIGGGIFEGLEGATGVKDTGHGTLENIEFATGMSKRKPRFNQEGNRRGITININTQKGTTRKTRGEQTERKKRNRDWQDNISELTGF